ncbi:MAG: hypothetical protein KKF85_11130 [Gammaproteobacteria bacterium]|nr:hypothetical protein [Rhodocyclaceae bacterium]MBU3907871.1 hypothetical protein [Gammaproteobacteria bacterium]MBU3987912.1 hypothetical protein [Gammaproteobacteria bacterium]MBU4005892.1 hypothetical protein [Gammaproteobacteria bacterium]MBU4095965.1 hypothetical protein [Gammaproteobacteria bacterium]
MNASHLKPIQRKFAQIILLAGGVFGLLAGLPVVCAAESKVIVSARYADPVQRYGHFAPGPPHEYGRIEANTAAGARLTYALPEFEVFEDVAPRLVRLSAEEPVRLLAVVSHRNYGSALALLGIEKGRLTVVARSRPIGTPMRWLNPVAVVDLDSDGRAEIAAVITPHIGGKLKIYRRSADKLEEVAALAGFSNHVYGSPELGLAMSLTDGGRTRLLVPDATRTILRIIEFAAGSLRETGRCALTAPLSGPLVALANGEVEATQPGGKQRVRLTDCQP